MVEAVRADGSDAGYTPNKGGRKFHAEKMTGRKRFTQAWLETSLTASASIARLPAHCASTWRSTTSPGTPLLVLDSLGLEVVTDVDSDND